MHPKLQLRVQRYGWDRAVEFYESGWRAALQPAQAALLEHAAIQSGDRVLDVAAGTGLVAFEAARRTGAHGTVIGTDLSDGMVSAATQRASYLGHRNVDFQQMNAEELAFDDNEFDAVLCALGLMYLPDPDRCLREMHRVARPGGRVVAAVWGSRSNCGWNAIFPIVDGRVSTDVCPLFFQLGTGDALAHAFRAAGMEDLRVQRISHLLKYESAQQALNAIFAGGPVAMAYTRFDKQTREEAHTEYLYSIREYRSGDGYEIPGEFVVVSAEKKA